MRKAVITIILTEVWKRHNRPKKVAIRMVHVQTDLPFMYEMLDHESRKSAVRTR